MQIITVYYDTDRQEILTEDETHDVIFDSMDFQEGVLEYVKSMTAEDIWRNLNENERERITDDVLKEVLEERFISREIEV